MKLWRHIPIVITLIALFLAPQTTQAITAVLSSVETLTDSAHAIGVYQFEWATKTSTQSNGVSTQLIRSLKSSPPTTLSENHIKKCLSKLKHTTDDNDSTIDRVLVFFHRRHQGTRNELSWVTAVNLKSLPMTGFQMMISHQYEVISRERELIKLIASRAEANNDSLLANGQRGQRQRVQVRIPNPVFQAITESSPTASVVLGIPEDLVEASRRAFSTAETQIIKHENR